MMPALWNAREAVGGESTVQLEGPVVAAKQDQKGAL